MNRFMRLSVVLAALWMATSEAATLRATEMNAEDWKRALKGGEALVVEFRHGDEIPVTFKAQGDFLETTRSTPSYVGVKQDFWLKMSGQELLASLDGEHFRPLREFADGAFEANAGAAESNGPVNGINLVLTANAKGK